MVDKVLNIRKVQNGFVVGLNKTETDYFYNSEGRLDGDYVFTTLEQVIKFMKEEYK